MNNIWTDEQKKILEETGNIIVTAAAGSGKTSVLTERIVRMVEEGTSLDRMLVVTFTKAAAAEMKQRIEKKLYDRSKQAQDISKGRYFFEQANAISRANISTLHSFCSYVLRRHFYEVDISPTFRVGDESETEKLLSEAIEEALGRMYMQEEYAVKLPSLFLGEERLEVVVRDLLKKVRSRSDGAQWLHQSVQNYDVSAYELGTSPSASELMSYVKELILMAYATSVRSLQFVSNDKQQGVVRDRIEHLESILNGCGNYEELYEALTIRLRGFSGTNGSTDELKACNGEVNDYYEQAQGLMPELHESARFLQEAYPCMQVLESLVHEINELYDEKKRKRGIVDYSDLEMLALKVLRNDKVAEIYRERFKYVFVDEYQDINPLQDEIISCVLSKFNAFFVGDVKQSIYRFRNAKPSLFIDKMKKYGCEDGSHMLDLSANFRSSDAVVNFTNTMFKTLMTDLTCGIDYDEKSMLKKMGSAGKGDVRVHLIEKVKKSPDEDGQDDLEELLSENAQAKLTAEEIKRMLDKTFYDAQSDVVREYKYSDFAIIMRSVKSHGDAFVRELLLEGIPVYLEESSGYFEALEVQVFINLLSAIDNRRQDVPLLSVMRSVIGNFSIDEITAMHLTVEAEAADGKNCDILDMLRYCARNCNNEKAAALLARLDTWNDCSRFMPITELVQMLLTDTGYYRFVSALPGGKRRAANLERFKALTADYENTKNEGLYGFLQYLEGARQKLDLGSPQESATEAVSILTMHKSKGLEYNVVILPDMQKSIVTNSPKKNALIMGERPIVGAKLTFGRRDVENIYYKMLAYAEKRALYADELRLLYVAFTRARDTLILFATVKQAFQLVKKGLAASEVGIRDLYVLNSATYYADWLIYALILSEKNELVMSLVNAGEAEDEELYLDATPMYLYNLPKQDVDRSYFERELERICEVDTTEAELDMHWRYPHEAEVKLMSKGSVTGFAHAQAEVSYSAEHVQRQPGNISAAKRGTATHRLLEKLPLNDHTQMSVTKFVTELERMGELSKEEAESLNIKGVAELCSRPLYKRMLASEKLMREQEFSCLVEAWRLTEDTTADELILVQGVIDCCFMENGKWVVVDYKTDWVDRNNADAVTKQAYKHKKQLELYAYIIEKITKIEVSECYISFINAYDVKVDL